MSEKKEEVFPSSHLSKAFVLQEAAFEHFCISSRDLKWVYLITEHIKGSHAVPALQLVALQITFLRNDFSVVWWYCRTFLNQIACM